MNVSEPKSYLGDGCTVSFDGYSLWLKTDDGINVTNEICLEPDVYRNLVAFVAEIEGGLP